MKSGIAFTILFCAYSVVAQAQSPLSLKINDERRELEIRFKDRKLMVYAFAANQFKPYVRELYTLRGENFLRDSPADHLHHHGLMYAIRVNGVNFWEENAEPGIEKSGSLFPLPPRTPRPGHPAELKFTHRVEWLASTNELTAEKLLTEDRTLTLMVDESKDEVAVRWEAEFRVVARSGKVKLHGSDYNGLGMRLPQSFDHVAKFRNSENAVYSATNSRNSIAAKWVGVNGLIDGREITIGIFSHPSNKNANHFFSLLDPFAYLSATQALDKQPLEYSAGRTFQVRYLVLVYSQPKSFEFLNQRYQRWEEQK